MPPPAPATLLQPPSTSGKSSGEGQIVTEQPTPEEAQTNPGSSPSSPAAAQEEDGQSAAFNPETGEINWDCPCLGGMADGPCGEDFKAAFSCFVFSDQEPKGVDCVDKFKAMQDCFRLRKSIHPIATVHLFSYFCVDPDIYGAELADDEEPDSETSSPPSTSDSLSSSGTSTQNSLHSCTDHI